MNTDITSKSNLFQADLEEEVLRIIRKELEANRLIILERICSICAKEFHVEKLTIVHIIQRLHEQNKIALGQRLIREILLKNSTRKNIFQLIKDKISCNFSEIQELLDINNSVLEHHLVILERFKCVKKISFQRRSIYTLSETREEIAMLEFIQRNPILSAILTTIFQQKSADIKLVVNNAGISNSSALRYIKILSDHQIIRPFLEVDKVKYTLTENYAILLNS